MSICVGPSAAAVVIPPTLTLGASTNYNQNSAVLNATVTATGNRAITSVEFQWSNSPTFTAGVGIIISAWTAAATNTVINQGTTGTARTLNATGLIENESTGTPYYVRFRATNSSGFVTTSGIGGSFTTYKKRTETFTGSRTWTNPRTSSGTSGLAITSIQDCIVVGGGSGSVWAESSGAGGGGVIKSSFVSVGSNVVVTIGGGGAMDGGGYDSFFGFPIATGGTASTLVASSTLTAGGGQMPYIGDGGNDEGSGGASGNGNPGGAAYYDVGGGGGGAGGAGGAGNPSPSPAGAGGPGIDGYGGGGGGTYPGSFDRQGSPRGNGPANTGRGAAGAKLFEFAPNDSGENGGSGYAQFKYWGP
jgi:hypothetical protein